MHIITREWLEKWRTQNGGYNRQQVEAIGVTWPLQTGWLRALLGRRIFDIQRQKFEELSGRKPVVKGEVKAVADRMPRQTRKNRKGPDYDRLEELKRAHAKKIEDDYYRAFGTTRQEVDDGLKYMETLGDRYDEVGDTPQEQEKTVRRFSVS